MNKGTLSSSLKFRDLLVITQRKPRGLAHVMLYSYLDDYKDGDKSVKRRRTHSVGSTFNKMKELYTS